MSKIEAALRLTLAFWEPRVTAVTWKSDFKSWSITSWPTSPLACINQGGSLGGLFDTHADDGYRMDRG